METIKNIQFTERLKSGGRLREFNFRRSTGVTGPLFTVDVADERGDRHYVMFRIESNNWQLLTNNVPEWIKEVLPEISAAIENYH